MALGAKLHNRRTGSPQGSIQPDAELHGGIPGYLRRIDRLRLLPERASLKQMAGLLRRIIGRRFYEWTKTSWVR